MAPSTQGRAGCSRSPPTGLLSSESPSGRPNWLGTRVLRRWRGAGTGVIIDEVFLGGGESQARLQAALEGLAVIWVGVRCAPEVAEAREHQRLDRSAGMARNQAERVHRGVIYDVVVDTAGATPDECAGAVLDSMADRTP